MNKLNKNYKRLKHLDFLGIKAIGSAQGRCMTINNFTYEYCHRNMERTEADKYIMIGKLMKLKNLGLPYSANILMQVSKNATKVVEGKLEKLVIYGRS